jgi:hypothetical protein
VVDVLVRFDAPDGDVEKVRERVTEALGRGALTGPDGQTTTWQPLHQPRAPGSQPQRG